MTEDLHTHTHTHMIPYLQDIPFLAVVGLPPVRVGVIREFGT